MKGIIKNFIAGIIGVLFGGLILGFAVDLILYNRIDSGTTAFGNWAMWVAAIATIFAAIGTISTLGFLVFQHIKNNERQLRIDEQQLDMWKEQRELLKVQKLQVHRELFFDKLSEIELSANIHFEFYEKGILHDSLFNMRGVNLSIDNTNLIVKSLHTSFSRINIILDSPPSEKMIKELLNILHDIYRFYLYADPGVPKMVGDLSGASCINKHLFPIVNVFDIENQITALLYSYHLICSFGNHSVNVFENRSPIPNKFKLELIKFAASRNSHNSSYRFVNDQYERLNFVLCLYDLILNDKNYDITWPSAHQLNHLFSSSQKLSSYLDSDSKFQALLVSCKKDLYEAGEMDEQNYLIIDQLDELINSL
ncbi:hypothetical protein [Vibrio splendidus]|uniref:hypothetical protein n=1 Tax=Vibrio splendidus TaxID=29497 RepID=UPI000D3C59DB|nr:hypothetical protein [Vibrio splendidus]PTP67774.1 hypothetical protein CWO31_04915 [Vibrio splendidus]